MDRVGPLVCPILVGRDDLLELAARRLEAGQSGRGHLLFLAGEAGVGKTRLLGSIERRAQALGYRVVRGGTFPGDLEVAGAVFIDLARALARTEALAPLGERLTRRLLESASAGQAGDAHRRRRMVTLEVAGLLAEAAAGGPTLIALEDLHQADDLTLEILGSLARQLPELPLVVVATYRSDELFPRIPLREWRARLLTQRLAEEARLGRLSLDDTARMTQLLLRGTLPVSREIAERIHRRTDGIPLHVEEIVGLQAASGELSPDRVGAADVPDTLDDAIIARMERRTIRARELARIGAVIGRSFEFDLLADVVGKDLAGLSRPLEELADHFFLAPSPTSGRYGFRHALICDAIYGRIPEPDRRRMHARVADVAAARGDFSDAFLSSHFERAGRREEAFTASLRAARAAVAISARREAYDLYARAVRNQPAGAPATERATVLTEYGLAAAAADDNTTAVDALERAQVEYRRAGRTVEAAALAAPLVAIVHLLGEDLAARAARLEAALDELSASPPDGAVEAARARLRAGLASAYMLDRRLDEAIGYGEAARDQAAACGDAGTERNASVTLGACLVFAGRMDEGWARLEESLASARAAGLEVEAARAYRMLGSSASVLVEYERAERSLREGIDYAERVELWNDRHYMAAHLGHVLWATGRWEEAGTVAQQALADGRGGITTRITALHVLGYLAMGRGDWVEAQAALEEALTAGQRMRELQRLSPALWGLAETALLRGDADAAIEWSRRGEAASAEVEDAAYLYPFLVTGTRAHLAATDPAEAGRWVTRVEGALRRRSIPGTLPAIDHAQGLVLVAQGATGRGRDALSAASAAWQARGRAWEAAWARLDLARCLARSNRHADAISLAGDADSLAERIGSVPLREQAAAVLKGARAHHAGDEPWRPLTVREFEVACLIGEGLTNAAIAEQIGVAPKTVSAHVEHILAKLGASRRAEVARWAASVGPRTSVVATGEGRGG
ncbi:MAG TPA: AAA family ATPase [Vitreimonas sp.]|nr:AAA family ATPase [Vitreimonas sp.]